MRPLFRVIAGVVCLAATVTAQSRLPRPTPEGVTAQIMALSSGDATARATAACHLGWMGRRAADAVPALVRVLADDSAIPPVTCRVDGAGYVSMRAGATTSPGLEAARALTQIRDPRSVQALRTLTTHSIAAMRVEGAIGLGRQGDAEAALPALLALLKDPDQLVRMEAVTAVGRYRNDSTFDVLMAALGDPSLLVRERAVIAVGNLRDPRSVPSLVAVLKDPDPALREHAVVALGALRDARAVDPLIAALRDPDALVREQAARALSRLPRNR